MRLSEFEQCFESFVVQVEAQIAKAKKLEIVDVPVYFFGDAIHNLTTYINDVSKEIAIENEPQDCPKIVAETRRWEAAREESA